MHIGKTTTKSAPERADNECRGESTARKQAEAILAEMNDMARDRNITKLVGDKRFVRLKAELYGLGWLALVKTLKFKGREMYVQLKLVALDSEEAREVVSA
jgi:hypothetical protein